MEYKKYKIDKLRELCGSYNLSAEGKKEDLVKRLSQYELSKNKELEWFSTFRYRKGLF